MGAAATSEAYPGGASDIANHMPGKGVFTFKVEVHTHHGDEVRVVGSEPMLGAWNPHFGQVLKTTAEHYPVWYAQVVLPASAFEGGHSSEYKFVVKKQDGHVVWEHIPNRHLPRLPIVQRGGRKFNDVYEPEGEQEDIRALEKRLAAKASDGDLNSSCSTSDATAGLQPLVRPESLGSVGLPEAPSGPFQLWSGAWRAPKIGGKCEDAYFCSVNSVGVADGVSQIAEYAEYGINAAAYSHEIMTLACKYFRSNTQRGTSLATRTMGALRVAEEQATTWGASTVAMLTVDGSDAFVANLGDSGYILLRQKPWGWDIVESSTEQHHAWNCPYQLTRVPDVVLKGVKGVKFDHAADCDKYEVKAQPGDLFLLFTDGLSDNLYWYEVLNIVSEVTGKYSPICPDATVAPQVVAKALVKAAEARSLDPAADTPFARAARRHRQHLPGGKVDDITVVAAWVLSPQGSAAVGPEKLEPEMATVSSLAQPSGSEKIRCA
mmetsp:Transcript_52190/g.124397  ORF Transcript_52190/g.124397 Transcript_52190/m.124397 type:complete len:491 (-) Transcript_52190:67-1539(-)